MPTPTRSTTADAGRAQRLVGYGLLGALAYVPLLLAAQGRVAADTKQYLYLDPGRLLSRAPYLWDPNVALGTVTHQNIGYLFPAGPFYWLLEALGSPDWVAQRLWLGSILFAAGTGVLYLMRTLHVRGPGVVVAALVYMLSPYSLQYASRLSILLTAWAALPWMIAFVARALREGGWRYPAAFAIAVQLAGSVNATALVLAGVGPLLWFAHAVWVTREVSARRAVATLARIGVLTVAASLWWIAGLSVQAEYGLNVLRYTETVEAVATAGLAPEVVRGLGYWFFYGGDKLGPWIESAVDYTQRRWLIAVGYGIPVLGMCSAAFVRWRHRVYFVALVLAGVTIAVGTHPYDDPSPFGSVVKAFAEGSTVGLALRSVGRAIPLIALGIAVLLGVGANSLVTLLAGRGRRSWGIAACALLGALAVLNLPALWNDTFYGSNLQRPEDIPSEWTDAIALVDSRSHDTRILELPGSDFSSYRWGNTVEPITPGLTDRPYVARELIPYGSAPSAQLLADFDRRLQLGLLDARAVASIARLLSVGDIVLRNDLQVDRFDLARPREVWALFGPAPNGLTSPQGFGDPTQPPLVYGLLDERALALPVGSADPPPVAVVGVADTQPIVRSAPDRPVIVVSGDAEGLIDLASLGLLDRVGLLQYSASLAADPAALRAEIADGATLVITDTNRRRARRWDSVRDNVGYTERDGEQPLVDDTFDARLDVFPDAGSDAYTVMEQRGARVSASGYGTHTTYLPADRPARALDGDVRTAWRVGAFAAVEGERIRIDLDAPITTNRVSLVQPLTGMRNRYITRVALRFADAEGNPIGRAVTAELGPASRTAAGQAVKFPSRRFSRLEIVIESDNVGAQADYPHESAVGFAEIGLRDDRAGARDVRVDEVVRMPSDLVRAHGAASGRNRLVYEMSRLRTIPASPNIAQEETALIRSFEVSSRRTFGVSGTARLALDAPDEMIDAVLGIRDASSGGITARSSERLPTTIAARASSALDGDLATAWTTPFGSPVGQWVEVEVPDAATFDHLDLVVVADGRHSVPTRVRIEAGGETRVVEVPAVADSATEGATTTAPIEFAALTGDRVRVTIDDARLVPTLEYYSNTPVVTPVSVAELGLDGVERAPMPEEVSGVCRTDLVRVDGRPAPVRITGPAAVASSGGPLAVSLCSPASPSAGSLDLDHGTHVLRATAGRDTGFDVDSLVLASTPGGAALVLEAGSDLAPRGTGDSAAPHVEVTRDGRTEVRARVRAANGPFWLVLGESFNDGWHAEVDGRDLGQSRLVDGFANGWRVDPRGRRNVVVTLTWTPQRRVWVALAVSALTLLGCAFLVLRRWWSRPGKSEAARAVAGSSGVDTAPTLDATRGDRTESPEPARRVVVTTVVAALVAAVLVDPLPGLLVGVLTYLACVRPGWRWVLALGAPACLAGAGGYIVVQQWRHWYPSVFGWPTYFDEVHVLGWLAVVLLAATALVDTVSEGSTSDARYPRRGG